MGDDAAALWAAEAGGRVGILEGLRSVLIGTGDAQLPDTNELGSD